MAQSKVQEEENVLILQRIYERRNHLANLATLDFDSEEESEDSETL